MAASNTIPAVHNAVAVLGFIADRGEPVGVKELSYGLDIPPASCYRLVRTLLEHNWLREDPVGGLRIGFGLAHAARGYSEVETLLRQLETPLRRLAMDLEMSTKITLREGYFATTALRAEPDGPNSITSPIGYRFHLTIGSAAAVLLSALEDREIARVIESAPEEVWQRQSAEDVWARVRDCRTSGICHDLGQYHPAIFAISTPLTLSESLTVSLTAIGWSEDFVKARRTEITQRLQNASVEMEASLES